MIRRSSQDGVILLEKWNAHRIKSDQSRKIYKINSMTKCEENLTSIQNNIKKWQRNVFFFFRKQKKGEKSFSAAHCRRTTEKLQENQRNAKRLWNLTDFFFNRPDERKMVRKRMKIVFVFF